VPITEQRRSTNVPIAKRRRSAEAAIAWKTRRSAEAKIAWKTPPRPPAPLSGLPPPKIFCRPATNTNNEFNNFVQKYGSSLRQPFFSSPTLHFYRAQGGIWFSYATHLTSPHLTSPHLTSPHLTSPHLTSHHLIILQCSTDPRTDRQISRLIQVCCVDHCMHIGHWSRV
jgi:hypothetical protein